MDQDIGEGRYRLEVGGREQETGMMDSVITDGFLPAVIHVAASVRGQGPQIVGSRSA